MSRVPDLFEAITAYRVWTGHPNGLLSGQFHQEPWPPYEPMVGRCGSVKDASSHLSIDHRLLSAPTYRCDCGIHAVKSEEQARFRVSNPSRFNVPSTHWGNAVWGTVRLWGRVIEHEEGYRAEFGYPGRLYCEQPELATAVSMLYGVPVEVVRKKEQPDNGWEEDHLLKVFFCPHSYFLSPLPAITVQLPSPSIKIQNFWRGVSPDPPPSPIIHPPKRVQSASLSQVRMLQATRWQKAERQMQDRTATALFQSCDPEWREMWKSGFKVVKH